MTYPAIPGDVIAPSRIASSESNAAHNYYNVVRDLVRHVGYLNESQALEALAAVDAHERHQVGAADLRQLTAEDEVAPYEDVSQRIPPRVGGVPVPAGPAIDYGKLAQALVAAQQQAQADAAPPAE